MRQRETRRSETQPTATRLTSARLEAPYASVPSAALMTLLATPRADPAWTVTAWTAGRRLVQVELVYHPTAEGFTLRPTRYDHAPSVGAGQ